MGAPSVFVESVAPCAICGALRPSFRWTDTHGVGACNTCGAPYRIYHYEDGRRVSRPPELLILREWVPFVRRFWEECGSNVSPGYGNLPGSDYEVATRDDFEAQREWFEAHEDEMPA